MSHRTLAARWKKKTPPLLLSIDHGTSGLGAVAIDALTMETVAASKAIRCGIYPQSDGAIKCQPQEAIDALKAAMQDLQQRLSDSRQFGEENPLANVVGLGVVGHMHAGIWLDERGTPVDLASMWNCPSAHEDGLYLSDVFKVRVARRLTLSHVRKELRTRRQWWLDNVRSITTPAGFLTWWLTGINAVGPGEYSGMGLLDVRTGQPSPARLTCLVKEFGVDLTPYAPRCLLPGSGVLSLNARGQQTLGLPVGVNPVVLAGEGDQISATEFFRLQPGEASGSFGTSGPINCIDPEPRQDPHRSTDNFRTGTGLQVLNMGLVVVCGAPIESAAKRLGSFERVNEVAKTAPIDCGGAVRIDLNAPEDFLGFVEPYFREVDMPSPLTPGVDAQLAYLQTAMITRHRMEMMGRGRATPPTRFVVGGGPTQSDRFLTTLATALNLTLELPEGATEATACGLADLIAYEEEARACRNEGRKTSAITDYLAELRTKPRPKDTISPQSDAVSLLDEYYRKFVQALAK